MHQRNDDATAALERVGSMKVRASILAMVVLLACLGSIPLRAQPQKKWTPADIVAKAKPGQWVELEGIVQDDYSVLALEIEFLVGDFMDDDWELYARVEEVTPAKNEFRVLLLPVKITKETDFDKDIKKLADVVPGMMAELEGTYFNDGTFLAKEVEIKVKKGKAKPKSNTKVEAIGKVGQVDEAKRIITVMGVRFHITEDTEGKSAIN